MTVTGLANRRRDHPDRRLQKEQSLQGSVPIFVNLFYCQRVTTFCYLNTADVTVTLFCYDGPNENRTHRESLAKRLCTPVPGPSKCQARPGPLPVLGLRTPGILKDRVRFELTNPFRDFPGSSRMPSAARPPVQLLCSTFRPSLLYHRIHTVETPVLF